MFDDHAAKLASVLEQSVGTRTCTVIAIDGCGGAGKSTFASALAAVWPGSEIVHTDDFASWDNPLDWWPRLLTEVLQPLSAGRPATYLKTDWLQEGREEYGFVSGPRVILEGVSSSRLEFREHLSFCVWIDTPREERLKRGLERDGISAAPLWQEWMKAEDSYVAEHSPITHADLILSGIR